MEEQFIKIVEDYEISNNGNCRKNGKIINGSICNSGYRYFQLNREGKRKNYHFHVLVALAFLGERPKGLIIDHIDRDKLNNNVSNLRYTTQEENCRNHSRYRDDILEKDKITRKRTFQKEYDIRTKHSRGIRRERGKGSISLRNNKWRAIITINGICYSKTYLLREEAENYLESFTTAVNNNIVMDRI